MKKVEIKKEKNAAKIGTKKIDELYEKKILARKGSIARKGIPLKPLRKEDVLKKTPAYAHTRDDESVSEDDVSQKKAKKAIVPKVRNRIAENMAKSSMSDMLPKKDVEFVADDESIEEMSREELLGRKPIVTFGADSSEEDSVVYYGGMTKDEMLGRRPVETAVVEEDAGDVAGEEEEEIAAMRAEIKRKMEEKNRLESEEISPAPVEASEDGEKKSFFRALFSRNKEYNSTVKTDVIEAIAEDDQNKEGIDVISAVDIEQEKEAFEKKVGRDNLIVAFLVFVITSTIGVTAFYFYVQYRKPGVIPNVSLSSADQAKKDADDTKKSIGEIYELPDDEEPILATVTDVAKVKKQKFFANAQNGDRVLIYTTNKKAILFRPSTKKIIEVSQVSGLDYGSNSSTNQSGDSQSTSDDAKKSTSATGGNDGGALADTNAEKESSVRVAIYNGSKTKGLAQKIGDMIGAIPGVAVGEKTNAKGEYAKTEIIDLTGNQEDMAQRIAESLHGEIINLPDGEAKPDAEILVIGGSDFGSAE